MKLTPYTKAALAALCIGVGVALFASAVADVRKPCVGCEDDAEETVEAVAAASAEMDKIMEALDDGGLSRSLLDPEPETRKK